MSRKSAARRIYPNEGLPPTGVAGLRTDSIALRHQIRTLDRGRPEQDLGELVEADVRQEILAAIRKSLSVFGGSRTRPVHGQERGHDPAPRAGVARRRRHAPPAGDVDRVGGQRVLHGARRRGQGRQVFAAAYRSGLSGNGASNGPHQTCVRRIRGARHMPARPEPAARPLRATRGPGGPPTRTSKASRIIALRDEGHEPDTPETACLLYTSPSPRD